MFPSTRESRLPTWLGVLVVTASLVGPTWAGPPGTGRELADQEDPSGDGEGDEADRAAGEEQAEAAESNPSDVGREVGDNLRRTLAEQLEAWNAALTAGNGDRLRAVLDVHELFERAHALAPRPELAEPRFALQAKEDLLAELLAPKAGEWTRIEILRAVIGEEAGRLVVTTRSFFEVDGVARIRHHEWSWRKTEGGWTVTERRDLGSGVHLSWRLARAFASSPSAPSWAGRVDELLRGALAVADEDPEAVAWALAEVGSVGFAPELSGTVDLLRARNAFDEGRHDAALRWCREARLNQPDFPGLLRIEAFANAATSDWQGVLDAARAYTQRLGTDPGLAFVEGQAAAALGRLDEALTAFRTGLALDPTHVDNLLGLARALGEDGGQELRDHFRRLDDPPAWFETLVLELFATGDLDDVEALIEELRVIAPADPNGDYYEATLLMHRGAVREAADLLRDAFPKVADPDELRFYVQQYADACVLLGVPLEAYEHAPDSPYVFDLLCSYFLEVGRTEDVEELALRHELTFPDDPWLPYYRGEVLRTRGDLRSATLRFEEGLLNAKDADTREVYRWNLVRTLVDTGEARKAIDTVAPRDVTLRQVVVHAFENVDEALLAELIDLRVEEGADEEELAASRGVLLFWQGSYSAALERLTVARPRLGAEDLELVHVERALILSALRSGDLEVAQREARISTQRDGDPLFEAIVYAALGEHAKSETALVACIAIGYEAATLYADPDLGPRLSTEPGFANFRAAYPVPATDDE